MPVSLLIALFLAFGTDAIFPPAPIPPGSVALRSMEAVAEVGLVGLVGLAFSTAVLIRARQARATPGVRRLFSAGSRTVGALTLGGYAWVIHGLGWPEVVRSGLGLRDAILINGFR